MRLRRPVYLFALLVLLGGCRSTQPYTAPDVPAGATEIVLTSREMPRVLYAEAWGAFARFGWEIESSNPAMLRLLVRPPGAAATLDVYAEEQVRGGRVGEGRLVARVDNEADAQAVLQAAAEALATIPGTLTVR